MKKIIDKLSSTLKFIDLTTVRRIEVRIVTSTGLDITRNLLPEPSKPYEGVAELKDG